MRDETEWVELVDNKFNVLAGADKNIILNLFKNYSFNDDFSIDLYGAGKASKKIVEELLK